MKRLKEYFGFVILMSILFIFSSGISAEETTASDVIVEENNDAVKFIYSKDDEDTAGAFSDIPDHAWYNMFVSCLKQLDLVDGVSETEYAPQDNIKRSEFVKLLALLSEDSVTPYASIVTFTDGDQEDWYHSFEEWAAANEIVEGDAGNQFHGESYITREEAVVMLYRFAQAYGDHIFDQVGDAQAVSFNDEDRISDWAKEAVTVMAKAGVVAGDDEGNFNPSEPITRAEAAKVVAAFWLFDTRPDIIGEDGFAHEYLGTTATSETDSAVSAAAEATEPADTGFTGDVTPIGSVPYQQQQQGITTSWATSNHASMLEQSFAILAKDNENHQLPVYYINLLSTPYGLNFSGKLSINAQAYIKEGSKDPDFDETYKNTFIWHYYHYGVNGGVGTTKPNDYGITTTAYHKFNDHGYNAKCEYAVRNYDDAYNELGRSIHYLEDINAPHHAMLSTGQPHWDYEDWVRDNFYDTYWETGSASSTYSYMHNSRYVDISNNFSEIACSYYAACNNFKSNPTAAKAATAILTKKTQRAVAGVLYGFLADTGRAN